jgi:hypothetical protein
VRRSVFDAKRSLNNAPSYILPGTCSRLQNKDETLLLASDADYKEVRLYSGDGLLAFAPLGGKSVIARRLAAVAIYMR